MLESSDPREQKEWDRQYLNIFRNADPAFQNLFVPSETRPSIREVTEILVGEGGAHLEIGAGLFERAAGTPPYTVAAQVRSASSTRLFSGRGK